MTKAERRIGITGSRHWTNAGFVHDVLNAEYLRALDDEVELVIVHGGCPTGADAIAEEWCKENEITSLVWEADWHLYNKAAGPIRNRVMVKCSSAERWHAFVTPEARGTFNCIGEIKRAGLPLEMHSMVHSL